MVSRPPFLHCLLPRTAPPESGVAFLARALGSDEFRQEGVACGIEVGLMWVVVDPERHPLAVWRRPTGLPNAYLAAARSLPAVVCTNGPLMGKRLAFGRKATRRGLASSAAVLAGLAGVTGGLLARARWRARCRGFLGPAVAALGPAVAGAALGAWDGLRRWSPCGRIHSAHLGLSTANTFDDEGERHAWIGRSGSGFSSYGAGDGHPPPNQVEAMGGLLRLVVDRTPRTAEPRTAGYHPEMARLGAKRGVVAWALVPLHSESLWSDGDHPTPEGVIVVLGAAERTPLELAGMLARLGTSEAVATDLGRCSLLGVGSRILLAPPLARQAIQRYGLCCL